MTEEEFVITQFRNAFSMNTEDPIILYGLGKYTYAILKQCLDFNIVGVSAQMATEGEMICNRPIIPIEDIGAISKRVVLIARRVFWREIYSRICFIQEMGVKIYSICGEEVESVISESLSPFKGEDYLRWDLNRYISTDHDRMLLDIFFAKSFAGCGFHKLQIDRPEQLGLFVGPLVLGFISWLFQKLENHEDTIVWFLARDGYFIQKIYEKYKDKSGYRNLPNSKYTLASRRNLSVISIQDEEDILEIIRHRGIKGNLDDFLFNKFGLCVQHEEITSSKYNKEQYILKYKNDIIENAREERHNYEKYIENEGLIKPHVILFDLVTSGTAYRYAKKVFSPKCDIELLCFQYLECEVLFQDNRNLFWMGASNFYQAENKFTYLYPICEVIFGSPEEMFMYFDSNNQPHYVNDFNHMHQKLWLEEIVKIQDATEEWIDEMYMMNSQCFKNNYSLQLIDKLFSLLTPSYTDVSQSVKDIFILDNPYENIEPINIWKNTIDMFLDTI